MRQLGADKWKEIADKMGMKNRREAIIEFLRLDLSNKLFEEHLGHVLQQDHEESKTGREIKPIDQVDVFKWHC